MQKCHVSGPPFTVWKFWILKFDVESILEFLCVLNIKYSRPFRLTFINYCNGIIGGALLTFRLLLDRLESSVRYIILILEYLFSVICVCENWFTLILLIYVMWNNSKFKNTSRGNCEIWLTFSKNSKMFHFEHWKS